MSGLSVSAPQVQSTERIKLPICFFCTISASRSKNGGIAAVHAPVFSGVCSALKQNRPLGQEFSRIVLAQSSVQVNTFGRVLVPFLGFQPGCLRAHLRTWWRKALASTAIGSASAASSLATWLAVTVSSDAAKDAIISVTLLRDRTVGGCSASESRRRRLGGPLQASSRGGDAWMLAACCNSISFWQQ